MMLRMMGFRGGLMCQPGVRCKSSRSAATLKNACVSNPVATKSKAVLCPHITPRMTKLASEAAKAEKTSGFLSKRWTNTKKCPKYCTYMDRQCPPLVPPIVKPKLPPTKELPTGLLKAPALRKKPPQSDVPFAAVMAYRLFVFGAKLGVAGYCVKWTIDNGIWGSSQESSDLWAQLSSGIQRSIPQIHVLSGTSDVPNTLTQCWNATVITVFDSMIDASRWVKRKVVEKERQVYGLPPLESSGVEYRDLSGSIKFQFSNLTERWRNDNTDADDIEDSDIIQPDSPEYYGTKPGSAILQIEEEEEEEVEAQKVEGEDIHDLLSIEVPEFELDLLITKPSIETNLISTLEQDKNSNSENVTGNKIEKSEGNKSQKENSLSKSVETVKTEITGDKMTSNRCHCNEPKVPISERSNLQDIPPCTRPDCPFNIKPEEISQANTSVQLKTK